MLNDKYNLLLLLATAMLISCASSTAPVSSVRTDSDLMIIQKRRQFEYQRSPTIFSHQSQ